MGIEKKSELFAREKNYYESMLFSLYLQGNIPFWDIHIMNFLVNIMLNPKIIYHGHIWFQNYHFPARAVK